MSPGSAPATATGPVMIWPGARGIFAAWTAASAGGMVRPEAEDGITSGPPEMHSNTTVSPESMVISGGKPASKTPQRTVSGVDAIRCVVMRFFLGASVDRGCHHIDNLGTTGQTPEAPTRRPPFPRD